MIAQKRMVSNGNTWEIIRKVYQESGPRGFQRGYVVSTLQTAPSTFLHDTQHSKFYFLTFVELKYIVVLL